MPQPATFKRPNVLLLYTDQQRGDALGADGNPQVITPNLDRLAREGVRCSKFHVQNEVCQPSRMSFLTGQYPLSLGIACNGIPLPPETPTLMTMLKPYGYHNAQIGKLHFWPHTGRDARDPHPLYGFDTFLLSDEPGCYEDAYINWVRQIAPDQVEKVRPPAPGEPGRNTHEPILFKGREDLTHTAFVGSETVRFIENHQGGPFFAIAGFYAPHTPLNPPKRLADLYDPAKLSGPELGPDEKMDAGLPQPADPIWKKAKAYYYAMVTHVDEWVGEILKALDKKGLAQDTIVIFTSDHGEFLGEHGRVQKWPPGHQCVLRVPFLVRYPAKIKPGQVADSIVEAVDMVPTILSYAGISIPRAVQGKSLKELFAGETQEHRDSALAEFKVPFGEACRTVVTRDATYALWHDGRELLYDRKIDPKELVDRARDKASRDLLAEMRKLLLLRILNASSPFPDRIALY